LMCGRIVLSTDRIKLKRAGRYPKSCHLINYTPLEVKNRCRSNKIQLLHPCFFPFMQTSGHVLFFQILYFRTFLSNNTMSTNPAAAKTAEIRNAI